MSDQLQREVQTWPNIQSIVIQVLQPFSTVSSMHNSITGRNMEISKKIVMQQPFPPPTKKSSLSYWDQKSFSINHLAPPPPTYRHTDPWNNCTQVHTRTKKRQIEKQSKRLLGVLHQIIIIQLPIIMSTNNYNSLEKKIICYSLLLLNYQYINQ